MLGSGRSGSQPENNKSIKGSDAVRLLRTSGLPLSRVAGLSGLTREADEWDKAYPSCLLDKEEVEGVGGVI